MKLELDNQVYTGNSIIITESNLLKKGIKIERKNLFMFNIAMH